MSIDHYMLVLKTKLPDGSTLKDKVEAKFDVNVTDGVTVRLRFNQSDSQSNKIYDKKAYDIQVTGTQVKEAIEYLDKKLKQISCEVIKLQKM